MTKKIQIGLRVKAETGNKLKQIADTEHRSVNNLIEVIIEEYIKRYEQGEK